MFLPLPALTLAQDPRSRAQAAYADMPLIFESNQGQADPAVVFHSRNKGFELFLTARKAVFVFPASPNKGQTLSMTWNGSASDVKSMGLDRLPGLSHYFTGNDSRRWVKDVEQFGKAKLFDIYPGIDLTYYSRNGKLEFDWDVHPGSDPGLIELELEGMRDVHLEGNGDLRIEIIAGQDLILKAPVAFQEGPGGKRMVQVAYRMAGQHRLNLAVAPYDKGELLVIDPVLEYSTFLGGSNYELGFSIAVDSSGNAYVSGSTFSTNFPTSGPLQGSCGSCTLFSDAFVSKLDASGTFLLYSTYLGGNDREVAHHVAVDGGGNAYLTGFTHSLNFPLLGALQSVCGGCPFRKDAFVTKLAPSGSALVYSTYLGGSLDEDGMGIAVDGSGNAFVTGATYSTNFPVFNAYQASKGAGVFPDAFVSKLNSGGTALIYSTYLGGSNTDGGLGVVIDNVGNAYVTGHVYSSDFPLVNPLQAIYGGGGDAFVSQLNNAGNALIYSTYLGGAQDETGRGIALDLSGNAYVTGETNSTDFPLSNALQSGCGGCSFYQDVFVSELDAGGSTLVYSTYLGGTGQESVGGIAVDVSGIAYVTGTTFSPDFPIINAVQPGFAGGGRDAFVTKYMAGGTGMIYSTFLGGNSGDDGKGVAIDAAGNAYVVGDTYSSNFPLSNPMQGTCGGCSGFGDAFVAKISEFSPSPSQTRSPTASSTATPTPSQSSTVTPTLSMTQTSSPLPTPTCTPTFESPTTTPSKTASPSPTSTLTVSPLPDTPTSTRSSTVTPTYTTTLSPAPTPTVTLTPAKLLLNLRYPNSPNPFGAGGTYIPFWLSKAATVKIRVYTVSGETVVSVEGLSGVPGGNEYFWDGRNSTGREVATGVFIYRVFARSAEGEEVSDFKKMAVVR